MRRTTNLDLPLFDPTDQPSWLNDVNDAMSKIDAGYGATAQVASDAAGQAGNALNTANAANTNAQNALTAANTAVGAANQAVTTANGISGVAQSALTTAQSAATTAASAQSTAQSAEQTANGIAATAQSALTTAQGAEQTANTASTNAAQAISDAAAANTAAGNAATAAQNAQNTADAASTAAGAAASTANAAAATAQSANTAAQSANTAAQSARSIADSALSRIQDVERCLTNSVDNYIGENSGDQDDINYNDMIAEQILDYLGRPTSDNIRQLLGATLVLTDTDAYESVMYRCVNTYYDGIADHSYAVFVGFRKEGGAITGTITTSIITIKQSGNVWAVHEITNYVSGVDAGSGQSIELKGYNFSALLPLL